MAKRNVVVLMGGPSSEHEISLISGKEVCKNLDPTKYQVTPLVIPKKKSNWLQKSINTLKKADVVFIALHGQYGEDGRIQAALDLMSIKYTGSKVLASALGMDKVISRIIFEYAGLTIPKGVILKRGQDPKSVWQHLKPPVFVKPNGQGSSVGTSKVKNKKDLEKALSLGFKYASELIIDEYIEGTELTCAILGNENPKALPLVEIAPKKEFFDYEAKYTASLTDEIVPARISTSASKKAQEAGIIAYKTIGCTGFGRVDMILKKDKVYILEVNTIPGLTPVSLFPKAADAAGLSYSKLLDEIINLA